MPLWLVNLEGPINSAVAINSATEMADEGGFKPQIPLHAPRNSLELIQQVLVESTQKVLPFSRCSDCALCLLCADRQGRAGEFGRGFLGLDFRI